MRLLIMNLNFEKEVKKRKMMMLLCLNIKGFDYRFEG